MSRVILLFFILISSGIASACSGNMTFPLAALTDSNEGGIVNVYIEAFPSQGSEVLISVPPYYGVDLQRSITDAAGYSGIRNCTIVVRFDQSSNYMEGPSAGAAFAVALYSLTHNVSFINKPMITGALGPDGIVRPVGGAYEKAVAASRAGMQSFVCPRSSVYDYVILEQLGKKTGMQILHVRTVDEILAFMIENRTPAEPELSYPFESENISSYPAGAGLPDFYPIAKKMVERANDAMEVLAGGSADEWISGYYLALVDDCGGLLEKNYVYTAANNAFLAYVDIKTLNFVYTGRPSYAEEKEYVSGCLSALERPRMTGESLEWVTAFDLRKAWAEDNLRRSNLSQRHLAEEEWVFYHDLIYAEAWCIAARDFAAAANEKNSKAGNVAELDESIFAGIAAEYLEKANSTSHSSDTQRRFEIAKRLYEEGKYAAAIFDFAYVLSMDESSARLAAMDDEELEQEVQRIQQEEMPQEGSDFMWPNIYRSQAAFLAGKENPDYRAAFQLFSFSKELGLALAEMADAAGQVQAEETVAGAWKTGTDYCFAFAAAALSATFILFVLLLLHILQRAKRRSYEREHKPSYRASGRERKRGTEG